MVFDASGSIYGVLDSSAPVAYKLTPPVSGTKWTITKLFSFPHENAANCVLPSGLVMDKNGNLFGVSSGCWDETQGSIYELSPPKKAGGRWTGGAIYTFGDICEFPGGGLSIDSEGNLYGACFGASYKLSPPAKAGDLWTAKSISKTSSDPNLLPSDTDTVFAESQTNNDYGDIMEFKHKPTGWTHWILFEFQMANGSFPNGHYPAGGLVMDKAGNLYGTAGAGKYSLGNVFQLKPPKAGSTGWTFDVVRAFAGSDGSGPAGLAIDGVGNLYGVAECGGKWTTDPSSLGGEGLIFKLSPPATSGGAWADSTLYQPPKAFFPNNNCSGATAFNAPLVIGTDGALYGTANGPAGHGGSVFRLMP